MSKFSKFFAAITFAVVSATAAADTYHFNYYYPPGGGTELWSTPLVEGLRGKGHTVKQEFFKSCHDALSKAKTQQNAFVVMSGGDILQDTAEKCPAQKDYPALNFVSNLGAATFYLCTAPTKTTITAADLTGAQTYKVAMAAGSRPYWNGLMSDRSTNLNVRVIPYEALAAARAAVVAGTDVDLIFVANGSESIVSAGGKCIAASSVKNHFNLPFLGQSVAAKQNDRYATIDLWSMGTVSKDTLSALTDILKSSNFKEFLAKRPSSAHLGLGQ